MVQKIGLVRAVLPVVGLFGIIPACILIFLGLSAQTLLTIVLIFQLYILAIQAEIALKQTAVHAVSYQPVFDVITKAGEEVELVEVTLRNSGKYPAQNLAIGLRDDETGKQIEHDQYITERGRYGIEKVESLLQLAQGKEICIYFLVSPKDYVRKSITMRVMFEDVLGEPREITYVKFPKSTEFVPVSAPIDLRSKGLLKFLEDFRLVWLVWRMPRLQK